jgi:hypothetical protein
MTGYRLFSAVILSSAIALPAPAASSRNAITVEQVAAAMNGAGMQVSAQQVVLLSDVAATTSTPALKVESMERWGDHGMRVRLDCANREECLPFFVSVHLNERPVAQAVADSRRPSPAIPATRVDPDSYVVRAGSPAILLLDGDHIHIKLVVVCLQNGAIGQTILASSKDHKQTYTAKVGDGAVLRGAL